MYVRKKKNRSGTTSVVVVSKSSGRYKEIKTFGASSLPEEVNSLCDQAFNWIKTYGGQQALDFDDRKGRELEDTERFINNIENVL
ncbi:MAG: transposase, partial [Muribaculaceae bacterium]